MKKLFKISRFTLENDKFKFSHFDEYKITFLKSSNPHLFRIVVNGSISKQKINIVHPKENGGYKDKILLAISEYYNNLLKEDGVRKSINFGQLQKMYSKVVVKNIKEYLVPISKETSRDVLTSYNLI